MKYRFDRAQALIDLDALLYNVELLHRDLPVHTKIVAVIKADGYGHGAVQAAMVLEPVDYIFGFAVATVDEGLELRNAGIKKPIMLLGYAFPERYAEAIEADLWLAVFSEETARQITQAAQRLKRKAKVQIVIDTGMNRIGYRVNEQTADEITGICSMQSLNVCGMFTHFYASDAADKSAAMVQYEKFLTMADLLKNRGIRIPYVHCSNSAAIMDLPDLSLDLVRAGIAMYGLMPSDVTVSRELKSVMTLKSRVVYVKTVPAGEKISYGGTYTAPQARRIATICFGYADGYPRQLSNRAEVLIRGKRAPIRGRICMDQFMVDVTDIPDAAVGDEVTLIGADGNERITMEEIGTISGRFNYETACCISKRVPRVYIRSGRML